jgi:uncharacterized ion transporter superfamily protein YfcC
MSKKRKIPHTYVIVFFIVVLAGMLTWFIPGGSFKRENVIVNGVEREVIVNNSFEYSQSNPQTWEIFSALFDGFVNTSNIIVFILIIGGAFWIMNETKAIDVGIYAFLRQSKKLEKNRFIRYLGIDNIIIVTIMLIFSLFGAIFGMSEETIAFVVIFIPLSISMGYDSIVGVSMCFVAAGIGFAGAMLNPFTIGIAQGLSDLPLFSGIEYRFFSWIVLNIVGFTYVIWYAKRIKKNPKKSVVYDDDQYWRDKGNAEISTLKYHTPRASWIIFIIMAVISIVVSIEMPYTEMKIGNNSSTLPILPILSVIYIISSIFALRKSVHFFILNILIFTILLLIVGVVGYGWYVKEIATLFLVMGLIAGIAINSSANTIVKDFLAGIKDILSAAFIVGLAGGIIVVLKDGKVIDTILFYVSESMRDFGKMASVSMMYMFQTILNLIIPSGSAKAALTMPIMSQFSDLIGVSRQATVVAFQFGDGFTNMITPTSGVLIGVLGVARIPYEKWVKWVAPFILILIIIGLLLLIPTVTMDLEGF